MDLGEKNSSSVLQKRRNYGKPLRLSVETLEGLFTRRKTNKK